jgi:hypothetical protein
MHLKAAMMHMTRRIRCHEKTVMVNIVLPSIDMCEDRHVLAFSVGCVDVEPVGGDEVEMFEVERPLSGEVADAEAEMTQLIDVSSLSTRQCFSGREKENEIRSPA